LWLKALVTTIVSLVIWLAVYFMMESGWISLRPA
jgi:hypothetical protein